MEKLVEIKFDEKKLARVKQLLKEIPGKMPIVMSSGINRTASPIRTMIIRNLASILSLTQKAIREGNKINLIKATRQNWSAIIDISSRRIPLIVWKPKAKTVIKTFEASRKQSAWLYHNIFKKIYSEKAVFSTHYKIKRKSTVFTYNAGKGTRTLEGGFKRTMKSGHTGIFLRKKDTARKIDEARVASPGYVFENAQAMAAEILATTGKQLEHNIDMQVKFILQKHRGIA